MRKTLFKQNYKLLKKFIPELLTYEEPNFCFNRKPVWTNEYHCIYGAFAEKLYENFVQVGTYYYMDNFEISNKNEGEYTQDPYMIILFNNELEIARIKEFYTDNPRVATLLGGKGGLLHLFFNCNETSEETLEEREYNNYLNEWLREYSKARKQDKNYFQKLKIY